MDIESTITTLLRDGFILVFNQDKFDIVKTAESLIKAGVNNMEVTCRISKPLEKLKRLRKELPKFASGVASLIDSPAMLDVYNKANPQDPLPSVEQVAKTDARFLVSAGNFSDESYKKFKGKGLTYETKPGIDEINDYEYSKKNKVDSELSLIRLWLRNRNYQPILQRSKSLQDISR